MKVPKNYTNKKINLQAGILYTAVLQVVIPKSFDDVAPCQNVYSTCSRVSFLLNHFVFGTFVPISLLHFCYYTQNNSSAWLLHFISLEKRDYIDIHSVRHAGFDRLDE